MGCIDTYTVRNVLPNEADYKMLPLPTVSLVGSTPLISPIAIDVFEGNVAALSRASVALPTLVSSNEKCED